MAIVKAVSSRASIGRAIKYVTKDEKTEEKLISGIECSPDTAIEEMKATKELWGKTEGRQYKHFVHSFPPEEKITPEQAHEIAKQLCGERFKGHEVLIATHQDSDHIHSHIIVNSVNYDDGHKLQWSKADLEQMKRDCNELSQQHGLSIPEKGEEITTYKIAKYKVLEQSITGDYKSYVFDCYNAVKAAKKTATSREDFISKMQERGFETKWSDTRKHISFTDQDGNKVRNTNLENTFKESFGKEELEYGFEINLEAKRTAELAREQLRAVRAESLNEGTTANHSGASAEDTRAVLEQFDNTVAKSRDDIKADDSAKRNRIIDEQSSQRKLDRAKEQSAVERSRRSQGRER